MKFLLILLIIMFSGYFLFSFFMNKLRNFMSGNFQNTTKVKEEPKNENVIYRNQDVIVLKGEAKDENKSTE